MKQIVNNLIALEEEIAIAEDVFERKSAEVESAAREMAEMQKTIHELNRKRFDMQNLLLRRIKTQYEDDCTIEIG